MRFRAVIAIGLSFAAAAIFTAGCQKTPQLSGNTVAINGKVWNVELATTESQRYRGMSGRTEIPDDAGMLFVYTSPQQMNFCMRGCPIPIDIIFISADKKVVAVHQMKVEPDMVGRVDYPSNSPAQFVLEVAAGSIEKYKIAVNDEIMFSADLPDPSTAER